MIKDFFKYLCTKIVYPFKKYKLEQILNKYEGKFDDKSYNKWFEAHIEWCALTESDALIYTSYIREKKC